MLTERLQVAKNTSIVFGAQAGDEAKGKISNFVCYRENATYVIRAGAGPNAEHGGFLTEDGDYFKVNQLPLGALFFNNVQIRVGREVAVDPKKLIDEIEKYNFWHGVNYHLWERVKVDEFCPIVEEKHILTEQNSAYLKNKIGSTRSGSGAARVDYINRVGLFAKDIPLLHELGLLTLVENEINDNKQVNVIEVSQGDWLSLVGSFGHNCTSVGISVGHAMGQTRLNPERKKNAIMCVKTLPSREGSGDFGKVRRLTPQEIEDRHIGQKSSIDGEVRKIGAGIDFDLLKQTVKVNGPSEVALTFCDHWDPEMKNITDKNHITSKIKDLVKQIEHEILVPVTILETGKVFGSIIDLSDKNIDFKSVIHGAVPINN